MYIKFILLVGNPKLNCTTFTRITTNHNIWIQICLSWLLLYIKLSEITQPVTLNDFKRVYQKKG